MSQFVRCLLFASLLAAGSGCNVTTSQHPLVAPAEAKRLPALYGHFRHAEDADNVVRFEHIGPAGEGFPAGMLRILIVQSSRNGEQPLEYFSTVGFVQPVGKYHVLHLPHPKKLDLDSRDMFGQKWDPDLVAGYHLERLLIRADDVEVASLNPEFLAEQIASGRLAGVVRQGETRRGDVTEIGPTSVTITAETAELRKFFERHIEGKLFSAQTTRHVRLE